MARRFYDLDMQTDLSAGDDAAGAMARRAARLGFDTIALTDYVVDTDDIDRIRTAAAGVDADVTVRVGAKLKPDDPGDMTEMVRSVRDRVDVLVVHGGDTAINRAATGDPRVDILAHPALDRSDPGIDHVMADQAADNRVAVQVCIRRLLETRGKARSHVLNHMREIVRLCDRHDAPVIASGAARSAAQLRAPRELAAFPQVLGLPLGDAFDTVSDVPRAILDRADRVNDEGAVRPGVTVDEGGGEGGG